MATRLVGAGHELVVWNRTDSAATVLAAAGAAVAASPRDAARGAEIVFSMLRDDEASAAVWDDAQAGALAEMAGDAVAVECSTLSLARVAFLAGRCAEHDVAFIHAPVAGSRPQAEAGNLIFLAGGDMSELDRLRPLLEHMGRVRHAGPAGGGAALKLAVNTLFATQVAAMAEIVAMLEATGCDPESALAILGDMPVASAAANAAAAAMQAGNFTPQFPIELVAKDLAYMHAAAPHAPLAKACRAVFADASARGLGHENLTAIVKLFRAAHT
nr:NAD(P)-binding domain-containing protein [Nitratireductor mangrovi]